MKITRTDLRRLIREAYTETLHEQTAGGEEVVTSGVLNKILDDRFEAMELEIVNAVAGRAVSRDVEALANRITKLEEKLEAAIRDTRIMQGSEEI